MAFLQTTATDASDLLLKLATFLSSNGWTILGNSDSGAYLGVGDRQLHLASPNGNYFHNLYADTTSFEVYTTLSDAGGGIANDLGEQPGETVSSKTNLINDNYVSVFFYAQGQSFYVVVEFSTSKFRHIACGTLVKPGGDSAYDKGDFSCGTFWTTTVSHRDNPANTHSIVPFDAESASNINSSSFANIVRYGATFVRHFGYSPLSNTAGATGNVRSSGYLSSFYGFSQQFSFSQSTGRETLQPINVLVRAESGTGIYSLGHAEGVRTVNLANFTPKSTLTLGADTWRVFPLSQREGGNDEENSGLFGLAYLEG
jgi:hypothetical protein